MKFERRGGGDNSPAPEEKGPESGGTGGKKPVIVYILVLFIAAFLLMAWSLFSHQRSNTEALGRLQSSVTAMEKVQELQEQVIQLQKELAETRNALDAAQAEAAAQAEQTAEAQEYSDLLYHEIDALYHLYALQLQYLDRNYEACRATIKAMEDNGLTGFLSDGGGAIDVTSPALRYRQLKEALEALDAELNK